MVCLKSDVPHTLTGLYTEPSLRTGAVLMYVAYSAPSRDDLSVIKETKQ